jgi:hypothetical protein
MVRERMVVQHCNRAHVVPYLSLSNPIGKRVSDGERRSDT